LSGVQSGTLLQTQLLSLADCLFRLRQDQFDVARVRHVRVDTAVGTVGAATLLGGLVDLDVLDNEFRGIETLGVGVGLGVLEKTQQELSRLDRPAGFRDAKLLACMTILVSLKIQQLFDTPFKTSSDPISSSQ
jgi:hypothetical protein